MADRLQKDNKIDGIPKNSKPDFLRKVVENMSRDQYGNLVNMADNRPISLELSKTWEVAPLIDDAGDNPMNYMLINKKESTAYKRMRPYTSEGFEVPEDVEEVLAK